MLMNFLKKWVNRAIFSSHRTQTSRADASPGCSELTFWGNKGVLLWVNYLSGFKLYLCVWMRNCVRAWNGWTLGWGYGRGWGGGACWIDFDKLGTCEICRNLCSKVGFCFIISKSRSLAWLPCCNSISFSGFLSHAAFYSQRDGLKRKRFPPSPLTEVTLWAMMWQRRTRDNILTCTFLV